MRLLKIGAFIVGAVALLAVVISQVFKEQIGEYLYERAMTARLDAGAKPRPDGLHVILVGAGSPFGDPVRMGPSTAVIAGERIFVVDVGSGSPRNLARFNVPVGNIESVFITHFHSDHIDSLGELMMQRWANGGRTSPLPIYGPTGIKPVVNGFNLAYAQDNIYRVAHHGEATLPASGAGGLAISFNPEKSVVLLEDGDLKITAFTVAHHPVEPAVGYRFDYKGRSVTISGDTAVSQNLTKAATGTDLLIAEALNTEMVSKMSDEFRKRGQPRLVKITQDIPDYHISPVQAAEIAEAAGAKMLVYNHIVPAVPAKYLDAYFAKGANRVFSGKLLVGRDGMEFSMLPGTDKIRQK